MAKSKFPDITMHGGTVNNYSIDIHDNTFHGGTFHVTDLGKDKNSHPSKVNTPSDAVDPLSSKALEPYIRAGLLTENLMPAKHLSSGEVALLAHDIAERMNMRKYWAYFGEKWCNSCNSSVYSRFVKTDRAIPLLKKLRQI